MKRRLQNRIAESTATLPTAAVAATLLWWLPQGGYSPTYLLGWAAVALTAYILAETAVAERLLRVRSHLIPALYLIFVAAAGSLHPLQPSTAATPCIAAALCCLLKTADSQQPQLHTFHAYLLLAAASLAAPPLLLLAPLLVTCQALYLRTITMRTFTAALLGLTLPYALWATAAFTLSSLNALNTLNDSEGFLRETAVNHNSLNALTRHLDEVADPLQQPIKAITLHETPLASEWQQVLQDAQRLTPQAFYNHILQKALPHSDDLATLACILLIAFTGNVHYLRKSLDDKTRVRMAYYTFITLHAALLLWCALQPRQLHLLLPLLLLTTAPPAAHFVALTHTRTTNVWTFCLAAAIAALAAYTLR